MVHNAELQPNGDAGVAALVRAQGSASAPWLRALLAGGDPRGTGDAIHGLCLLYGRHPDPITLASARAGDGELARWLTAAARAFAVERRYLAALVAAGGPLPSTPNQAQSEAALAQQRHALETLARSDRAGCAIGAAIALVLDWRGVRALLDHVAARGGVAVPEGRLPTDEPPGGDDVTVERARLFGARQLLAQQRSLWVLLEARAVARGR